MLPLKVTLNHPNLVTNNPARFYPFLKAEFNFN